MVKLTFLGTGNAFGAGGRNASCYIIEGEFNILIDAGFSLFSAINSSFETFPLLDAILISHLHPDHLMGLPQMVLEDLYVVKRNHKIPVFGPIGLREKIISICDVIYNEEVTNHIDVLFDFTESERRSNFNIPGGNVITFPASHTGNARAQIISVNGVSVGYTGDSAFDSVLFKKLLECDVVITEATSMSHFIPDHTTVDELINANFHINNKIYISHVGISVIENREKILPPLYLAYDGLTIEINPKNQ